MEKSTGRNALGWALHSVKHLLHKYSASFFVEYRIGCLKVWVKAGPQQTSQLAGRLLDYLGRRSPKDLEDWAFKEVSSAEAPSCGKRSATDFRPQVDTAQDGTSATFVVVEEGLCIGTWLSRKDFPVPLPTVPQSHVIAAVEPVLSSANHRQWHLLFYARSESESFGRSYWLRGSFAGHF